MARRRGFRMTREEVLFDVWFSLYERRNFTSLAPAAFGHRAVMLEAWKARASLHVVEAETKGACPVCGCEETNSRGLWTCECPAPPSRCACHGLILGACPFDSPQTNPGGQQ